MDTQLVALETLRQRLNRLRSTIGMTYDYLDRGHPDAEQRASALERIVTMKAEADALEARLDDEVRRLRVAAPVVIETWVDLHLSVLDDILTDSADAVYLSHKDVRHFVAGETVTAWRAVRDGARTYVSINPYYLDDYEARLQARVPALNPAVRERAEILRRNLGKHDAKLDDLKGRDAD